MPNTTALRCAKQTKPTKKKPETTSVKPIQPTKKKKTEIVVKTTGDEIHLSIETRTYRVRGLEKNHSSQQLKVNILATRDELVHLDTFDLFKARSRSSFIKATASELFTDDQIIKRDMGLLLLELERLQQDRIEAATRMLDGLRSRWMIPFDVRVGLPDR